MKRLLFLFTFATLLCAGEAWAVCAAGCTTCVSPSASRADVNTCVTNAATGATITVPGGSQSWSSPVDLAKNVTLVGSTVVTCSGTPGSSGYTCTAGGTLTTLTCANGCFDIDLGYNIKITGFSMQNTGNPLITSWGTNQNAATHFEIYGNHLRNTANSWAAIRIGGGSNGVHPQGIWHSNRLEGGVAIHTVGTADNDISTQDTQNRIWVVEPRWGGGDQRQFVEANYFLFQGGNTVNYSDGNYSARTVVRYNTYNGSSVSGLEFHSPQGENRGYQLWEVYGNHFMNLDAGDMCYWGPLFIRGGTGVVFDNDWTEGAWGYDGCAWQYVFDNVRSEDDVALLRQCNGSAPSGVDQNTSGQQGWRCRDQVGLSHDLSLWDSVPPFGAWNQNIKPAYVWNNKKAGVAVGFQVNSGGLNRTHIQKSRDFHDSSGAACSGAACTIGVGIGTRANRPASCTTNTAYWATDEGFWNSQNGAGADGVLYKCTATNTWTPYYVPHPYPHPWRSGLAAPTGLTVK